MAVAVGWVWEAIVGGFGGSGGRWWGLSLSGGGQGNKTTPEVSTKEHHARPDTIIPCAFRAEQLIRAALPTI